MIDWTSWMDYGFMKMALAAILIITPPVSYTHLDVYKRQRFKVCDPDQTTV